MRLFSCVLAFALAAGPAISATADDLPLACKIVDKGETERVLGAPLGPPKFENAMVAVCAGLCPSMHASRCSFFVAGGADGGTATALDIDLGLPPFEPGDWPKIIRVIDKSDTRAKIEDVMWRGGVAIWNFRADTSRGVLDVFVGKRVQLAVVLEGIRDNATALSSARAIAARALVHLDRK